MTTRKSTGLRTAEVARRVGYSVQQVRNLERDGVLPPAARTDSGYRSHDERHVWSALAYRALATATGPVQAKAIMRAVHARPRSELFALLDAAHARLHAERQELALAKQAAEAIATEPLDDVRPSDAMSISQLAEAVGVRPSALRHWEAEGLVSPGRTVPRDTRRYSPADVRTVRIVHQLRLAGYRIDPLRVLLPRLGQARSREEVATALATRDAHIEARARALLDAAAALRPLLEMEGGGAAFG